MPPIGCSSSTTIPRSRARSGAPSASRATTSRLRRDGAEALQRLAAAHYDAVVLDVSMPRVDGLAVCRSMRARRDRTPVLMLTARDQVGDRVAGLDAGADDYLVKPFALDELNARVRALLRRANGDEQGERLSYLDLTLDLAERARPPRRAGARAHPHRAAAARAVPAQPRPGAAARHDLRARVGS